MQSTLINSPYFLEVAINCSSQKKSSIKKFLTAIPVLWIEGIGLAVKRQKPLDAFSNNIAVFNGGEISFEGFGGHFSKLILNCPIAMNDRNSLYHYAQFSLLSHKGS